MVPVTYNGRLLIVKKSEAKKYIDFTQQPTNRNSGRVLPTNIRQDQKDVNEKTSSFPEEYSFLYSD